MFYHNWKKISPTIKTANSILNFPTTIVHVKKKNTFGEKKSKEIKKKETTNHTECSEEPS